MSLGLKMVVPERVELSPYSFRGSWTAIIPGNNKSFGCPAWVWTKSKGIKNPCAANTPLDIHERVSIRPHWFSILYTWACNIWHRSRTRCIFGETHQNPSIKCTSHVAVPGRNILHSMFISDWKIEGDVPRSRTRDSGNSDLRFKRSTMFHPHHKLRVCFSQNCPLRLLCV